MKTRQNLVGMRFGKLVVINQAPSKKYGKQIKAAWNCRCDCGNIVSVCSGSLLYSNQTACACSHKRKGRNSPNWDGCGAIPQSYMSTVLHGARVRNLEYNLDIGVLWTLFKGQGGRCALSGMQIFFRDKNMKSGGDLEYEETASLDRIDSSKGYTNDNVQWVHKHINVMKNSHSEDYFLELCLNVVRENAPSLLK